MGTTTPTKFRIELELTADENAARVLRVLADLFTTGAASGAQENVPAEPSMAVEEPAVATDSAADEGGWDLAKVRKDALGGESQVWRPMLSYLAERRDQWVDWKDICAAVNRTPAQMAGALGAAERRCGTPRPYEKRSDGTNHEFRMPTVVAEVIDDLDL